MSKLSILLLSLFMITYKFDEMMEEDDPEVDDFEEGDEDFGSMADLDSKEFVEALEY